MATRTVTAQRYIIRTQHAGVFFAEIVRREGNVLELKDSRRIWYWEGAASLSELATRGTSAPAKCKFPCPLEEQTVADWVEIIKVTPKAAKSIDAVPEWTAHGT